MPVPNSFANVTTSIPLSQLDANFNTPITLGNTAIQLGNTVTTLNNMTLANVTVTSGNVTITNVTVTTANVTTANITTAIIGTANVTTANVTTGIIGTANVTTGNITTAVITTANVATANITTSQILNYGTANSVVYLNSSKAATANTGLQFDGTNLGLGVTPTSGWFSSYKVFQFGTYGALFTNNDHVNISNNVFINSSGNEIYANTDFATYYRQVNGSHLWFNAPSGTAGNAITFTQAMTLYASGNLSLGNTTDNTRLHVTGLNQTNGTAQFTANSAKGTNDSYVHYGTNGDWYIRSASASGNVNIQDTGGNVGVGTSSPANKLHVVGTAAINLIRAQAASSGDSVVLRPNAAGNGGDVFSVNDAQTAYTPLNVIGSTVVFLSGTGGTERARITSDGNFLVGQTSGSYNIISKAVSTEAGAVILSVERQQTSVSALLCYGVSQANYNAANAANKMGRDSSTLRSLNAGGTVNASGADYAEYMVKAGDFIIAKGDVCGIDANGKLTNVFSDAVSFVVKSTDPSYVGGDTWGIDLEGEELEAARQRVDRIAFAGQVPVNVLGASAGQYIVPVNNNGAIKGEAVSNPTFEQYQIAVGKVIAIEEDGRAKIIVKVA